MVETPPTKTSKNCIFVGLYLSCNYHLPASCGIRRLFWFVLTKAQMLYTARPGAGKDVEIFPLSFRGTFRVFKNETENGMVMKQLLHCLTNRFDDNQRLLPISSRSLANIEAFHPCFADSLHWAAGRWPQLNGWWLMASSRLTAESRSWFGILIVEGCMLHYIKSSLFACQLVVVYFTNYGPEVIRWQKQIT